jgi:hypothetical protein
MFRSLAGLNEDPLSESDRILKQALQALAQTQLQAQIVTQPDIRKEIPLLPAIGTNEIDESIYKEELPIPKILQLDHKPVDILPRSCDLSIQTRNGALSGLVKKDDVLLLGKKKPGTGQTRSGLSEAKPEINQIASGLSETKPLARQTILALASNMPKIPSVTKRPERKSITKIFDNTILIQGNSASNMLLNAIAPSIPGKDIPSDTPKRTLFLQDSALKGFDFCDDLADATTAPYSTECLQKLFLKMGGGNIGTIYPNEFITTTYYNTFTNWGKVRGHLSRLIADIKSKDLDKRATSLKSLFGIQYDLGWMNLPNKMTYFQITTNNNIIGIDSNFTMWLYRTKDGWKKLSGQGLQISIGTDGTICCIDKSSNVYLYHQGTDSWSQMDVQPMLKIAVLNATSIYGYNSMGQLWFYNGIKWNYVAGVTVGKDISVGTDGSLYYIGQPLPGDLNGPIYYLRPGSSWNSMANKGACIISSGDVANVWCIDAHNNTYKWNSIDYEITPIKMHTIAVGPEGKLIIGIDMEGSVKFWANNRWLEVTSYTI